MNASDIAIGGSNAVFFANFIALCSKYRLQSAVQPVFAVYADGTLAISRRAERVFPDPTQTAGDTMAKGPITKSALIQILVDKSANELTRKAVKGVLEDMVEVGHAELKKNGIFVVPGLVRMIVVKKPATKARKGINPFTKEPTVFKAKPARKVVKARPVKAAKDAIA